MKRIIFIMAGLFAVINLMAQDSLSFKGIPINGSMASFCQKLTAKGFTSIGKANNIAVFSGDFTGHTAEVAVAATDDGENVFAVIVLLSPSDEWKQLVTTYEYYKELYTRKYGSPTISKEHNPARVDSNTALMYKLDQGAVVYGSTWEVAGGDIQISIEKSADDFGGLVMVRYRNAQNVEAKIQSDLGDI